MPSAMAVCRLPFAEGAMSRSGSGRADRMRSSQPHDLARLRRAVGGEDDFVRPQRLAQAGQGHFIIVLQGLEKGLELALVRMIGDVTGIEQLHRQLTPLVF